MKNWLLALSVLVCVFASSGSSSADIPSPELIAPVGNISEISPTYTWNAASTATWYYLWINGAEGKIASTWYTANQAGCVGGTGTCTVDPAMALEPGSYTWWVRPWNASGYGPWSAGKRFTVVNSSPNATTLVSPTGATSTNTPTYTWNAVTDSSWYYLYVNDSSGTPIKTWYTAAQAGCSNGVGQCSVTPDVPVSGASTWWVLTWNNGGHGPWSARLTFNTQGQGVTARNVARLLTQATYGPTIPAIEQVLANGGPAAWIDTQLALPASFHLPIVKALFPDGWDTQQGRYRAFWDLGMQADDQLRQRLAFALSEIMVISSVPDALINHGNLVAAYYDLLVEHALGNYRDLLEAITLSPAMGIYLSMLGNEKPDAATGRRADENYAREVMQLFSIGLVELNVDGSTRLDAGGKPIPTYQQSDVENLARVFTGWSWDRSAWTVSPIDGWWPDLNRMERSMTSFADHHDTGAKQFLNTSLPAGRSAQQDLGSAINTLFNHANVGPFIAKQLIQRLVTSNPSRAYVARVATIFNDNGQGIRGDLGAVSKAILLDTEARSSTVASGNDYGKLREPLLRFSHLLRAFSVQDPVLLNSGYYISQYAALTANSVFNFFSPAYSPAGPIKDAGLVAPEFQINNETRVNRVNDALMAVTQDDSLLGLFPTQMNLTTEQALMAIPVQLLDRLNLLLLSGSMSNGFRQSLLAYIDENQTNVNDERILRDVIALIITSAEYAVQR